MRANGLPNVLSFLSLLSVVHSSSVSSSDSCTIQAWVRAPDLSPDTIVQGDARVKLSTGCTAVDSLSLGLRFKERSFVKAARDEKVAKRPVKELEHSLIDVFDPERMSPSSPWVLPVVHSVNCSENIAHEEITKNKNLWSVREEERVVFESTMDMELEDHAQHAVRDVTRDFAILVPSTNFPPALDYLSSRATFREREIVNVESIYEYFVRVAFTNGTTQEVSAGFTAFHPLYAPLAESMRFRTVELQTEAALNESLVESAPIAKYTAKVSTLSHLTFSQGSKIAVTVSITRTGLARTFNTPLTLFLCVDSNLSPKWAAEHTFDPKLQPVSNPNQILRATSEDFKDTSGQFSVERCSALGPGRSVATSIFMPNATSSEIEAGEIVTTTSAAVVVPVETDPRQAVNFETYYQTIANTLVVSLDVPRTQDEAINPGDFLGMRALRKKTPEFEDDEEAWVPWHKVSEVTASRGARTYIGNVPVSVRPHGKWLPKRCARAGANPIAWEQFVLADELDCEGHTVIHYLEESARSPTFVEVSAVQELKAKAPAERDLLAGVLDPVVSSPPEGEELVHRYYRTANPGRPAIYVGETWVKKVAHKDEHKVKESRPDVSPGEMLFMAQAIRRMMDEL